MVFCVCVMFALFRNMQREQRWKQTVSTLLQGGRLAVSHQTPERGADTQRPPLLSGKGGSGTCTPHSLGGLALAPFHEPGLGGLSVCHAGANWSRGRLPIGSRNASLVLLVTLRTFIPVTSRRSRVQRAGRKTKRPERSPGTMPFSGSVSREFWLMPPTTSCRPVAKALGQTLPPLHTIRGQAPSPGEGGAALSHRCPLNAWRRQATEGPPAVLEGSAVDCRELGRRDPPCCSNSQASWPAKSTRTTLPHQISQASSPPRCVWLGQADDQE